MNQETTQCQNCKNSFTIEPEDFAFYQKIKVPSPTFCPECRYQRRMSFMNERILYKRKCDLCGKNIIAMYPADSPLTVYCNPCWWGDNWNPYGYGRKYDPGRAFFEQLRDLIRTTPQVALGVNYPTLVNSDYINHAATSRNCYLIFTADYCENVYYSSIIAHLKESMDNFFVGESELCYFNINCGKCYMTHFSEDCDDCSNVLFSKGCAGCSNCFGCVNLRNKKYHIFNEPYSKEEYEKKIKEFELHTWKGLEGARQEAIKFWSAKPQKFMHAVQNKNATGDYVYYSKNAQDMFMANYAEDSRFCQIITLPTVKDTYDLSFWGNGVERCYDTMISGEGAHLVKFSHQCWPQVMDAQYCHWTMSSSYMFGCANIRKAQYCILNRQYGKEEFEILRERIIKDMNDKPYTDPGGRIYRYGEFMPPNLSLYAYNESYAMDFFPLTEEQARERGLNWIELPVPPQEPTLRGDAIPENIFDTSDSLTKEILECINCKKPFLVIPGELNLLRRFSFPVPRRCFNCRYRERIARVNPPKLWARTCAKCGTAIKTSYAPDRPEIVYCESCYQAEVQ